MKPKNQYQYSFLLHMHRTQEDKYGMALIEFYRWHEEMKYEDKVKARSYMNEKVEKCKKHCIWRFTWLPYSNPLWDATPIMAHLPTEYPELTLCVTHPVR
jgi:hypothetical protein